jgi:hypothetical protein
MASSTHSFPIWNIDLTEPSCLLLLQEKAYAFSMLVWHEQLLYAEDAESAATMLANKLNRLTSGFRNMLSWSK